MESEQDEPFEDVIFRNSQIIYPLHMTSDNPLSQTSEMGLSSTESHQDINYTRPSQPRKSVLEAFDPVFQRNSMVNESINNSPLKYTEILALQQLDFTLPIVETSIPPPLPERNPLSRVHLNEFSKSPVIKIHPMTESLPPPVPKRIASKVNPYDLVAPEKTEKTETPTKPTTDHPEGSKVSNSNLKEMPEEESNLSNFSTIKNMISRDKVKVLMNRVTNGEWFPGLKQASSFIPHKASNEQGILNCNPQHVSEAGSAVGHAGILAWCTPGSWRDPQNLWTELKKGVLTSYAGVHDETPAQVIKLENLLSIGVTDLDNSLSFELNFCNEKPKIVMTTRCLKERTKWMEWILESAYPEVFSPDLRTCYDRCGKVFIKEGVTRQWQQAWILFQSTSKRLWLQKENGPVVCEDLRKVHSIAQPKVENNMDCPYVIQQSSPIIIHWSEYTWYIQSSFKADTEAWLQVTRTGALQSGSRLEDNQLTTDNVPALVECCIKFIERYGMLSEGIYRRSGVQSKINRLLVRLQTDVWNVHISSEEYTEHDVANVLKRFFRTLPEPLLTNELYSQWTGGLTLEHDHQLKLYKHLIESLPQINRRTLRKLLGHLHAVQSKCDKNLMTVSNLAALWGPNIMTVESGRTELSDFSHANAETDVVLQLIQYYPWLFDIDREKLAVNDQISEVQEQIEQGAFVKKSAGDIRTWIYSEISAKEYSVEVGPKVTVSDALMNLPKSKAILMESVCNDNLRRPLSCAELLLPTILKWAEWSEEERKNNQLIHGYHDVIEQLATLEKAISKSSVFELHYSDPKGKGFRPHPFEFCQARFTLLKDTKSHSVQGRWNLENIVWYLGYDHRRNPPTSWCITFIEDDYSASKKSRQYFGHCLSFTSKTDLLKLVHAIILTRYKGGVGSFFL